MVIFYAGKGENEELSFQRKEQRRDNCCPFEGESNENEAKKIKENWPRKGGEDTSSAQKKRKDEGDPEGSLLYLSCYLDISAVAFI